MIPTTKRLAKGILRLLPRRARTIVNFTLRAGYFPHLASPRTFNEKLQYRKVHWNNPLFIALADKAAAKRYVASTIGTEYVIPDIYTGHDLHLKSLTDIVAKHNQIVMKTTHGSGSVYFLDHSSSAVEIASALQRARRDMKIDHGAQSDEPWYSAISPQIIVEPNISEPERDLPDYKFHVFSRGEDASPEILIQVDYDRHKHHRRSFFDVNGQVLDFGVQVPRSTELNIGDVMLTERLKPLAVKLARPFSYVRIDLYDTANGPKFGEFTFAHGSGYERFYPRSWDKKLGDLWLGNPGE